MFRRTKLEPEIQAELPDKIDQLDHCAMTTEQIGLYQAVLDRLILITPGNTSDSPSNPKLAGSLHWGGNFFTIDGVGFNDLGNGGALCLLALQPPMEPCAGQTQSGNESKQRPKSELCPPPLGREQGNELGRVPQHPTPAADGQERESSPRFGAGAF